MMELRFHEDDDFTFASGAVPRELGPLPTGPARPGRFPVRLFVLLGILTQFQADKSIYLVDAFSGKGAISWAFQRRGKKIARLDISLDPRDDASLHICSCLCA